MNLNSPGNQTQQAGLNRFYQVHGVIAQARAGC
jgi:hypothetical protein